MEFSKKHIEIVQEEIVLFPGSEKYVQSSFNQIQIFNGLISLLTSGFPVNDDSLIDNLNEQRLRKAPFRAPILIMAGGAALLSDIIKQQLTRQMEEALHDFRGTVISGGTTAGIPGLVGEIKSRLVEKNLPSFELAAYLPAKIPVSTTRSDDYDFIYETKSEDFSPLELLCYWTDIVLGGILPEQVLLIGINGGAISKIEFQMALTLGAKVALISDSGRAADQILRDPAWNNFPGLTALSGNTKSISNWINTNSKK
jgi:hypothetical protein